MKFGTSLRFNAVADWWDEYIAYAALRKRIYQLERQQQQQHQLESRLDLEANEHTALIHGSGLESGTDASFIPLLDAELKKICSFYEAQEKELLEQLAGLETLIQSTEEDFQTQNDYLSGGDDDDDDDEDDDFGNSPRSPTTPKGTRRQRKISSTRGGRHISTQSRSTDSQMEHRLSISSEEGLADLEASIVSLRHGPESAITPSSEMARRSPKTQRAPLSGLFSLVIPSGTAGASGLPAESIWASRSNYAMDTRILIKKRITDLYLTFTSLKSYVELNYTGFRKILKKYDKVTYSELQPRYLHETVEPAPPFQQHSKDHVNHAVNRLVSLYAKCVCGDDQSMAIRQLRNQQREYIAFERDTVWRQMIGRERRAADENGGPADDGVPVVLQPDIVEKGYHLPTPIGRVKLNRKRISLLVAVATFLILLNLRVVPGAEANKCFAILVFSTVLWATEAIPLFVTSISVPLFLVCLRVFREDKTEVPLNTQNAAKHVFQHMFSPTIMLLIGGFTIASAISKSNIDRLLITRVLSLAGTKPSRVLLAVMGVACFASMLISNVAAPTLCFALIRPILRTLPTRSSFGPCLIIGIALAANIGGQTSPISSPQNLIALQQMDPPLDWSTWFAVSIPVSGLSIILIWALLMSTYRPSMLPDGSGELEIRPIRIPREGFTRKQYWVAFVCILTIFLWCIESSIKEYVGDMGIIAILPIILFFSTGVLRKDDFEQFLWTIVFLAMGGMALGEGVKSSGLLEVFDDGIRKLVSGLSLVSIVAVFSVIVLIVSTFISHTIASILLVPIAATVGSHLEPNADRLLIFITALICSTGMGMPVSGFPNQTAATQEDEMGQLYLSNVDFLKNGVPASMIATLVVSTVGFLLMLALKV